MCLPAQEVLVSAGEDELRALQGAVHLQQVELLPLTGPVMLRPHLLRRRQDSLRLAEVDDDVLGVDPLDNAGHDVALAVGELLEHHLPLRLPQPLQDHLLGGLGGDAAGVGRVHLSGDDVVHGGVRLDLPGVREGDLGLGVFHLRDHCLLVEYAVFAGLPVYADDYVALEVAVLLVGGDEGGLHSIQDDLPRQVLLRSELRDRYHELALHARSTSLILYSRSVRGAKKKWVPTHSQIRALFTGQL